jgi:hypothetical protein
MEAKEMSCNCGASIGHPLVPKCICKPKKVRELTDEEILEVWKEHYGDVNIMTFARAILIKASEK